MARNRGTIDSIKVGLGIDMARAEKDIGDLAKTLQKQAVTVTPQIGAVRRTEVNDWLKGFDKLTQAGNAKKIKVPLHFDGDAALKNYKAAIAGVEAQVKPIVVPVHFERESDPTNEPGLEGGSPYGGRRGPRPSGSGTGRPARGGVSSGAAGASADDQVADLEGQVAALTEAMETLKKATTGEAGPESVKPKPAKKATKAKGTAGRTDDSSADTYEVQDDEEEEPGLTPEQESRKQQRQRRRATKRAAKGARKTKVKRGKYKAGTIEDAESRLTNDELDELEEQWGFAPRIEEHVENMPPARRKKYDKDLAAYEAKRKASREERKRRATSEPKGSSAAPQPIEMDEGGGVTSEQREAVQEENEHRAEKQHEASVRSKNKADREARADAKKAGSGPRGRQRTSRPGVPVYNPDINAYELDESKARTDSGPQSDAGAGIVDEVMGELEGQEFGSIEELKQAVSEQAVAKGLGDKPADPKRKRRFDGMTEKQREKRLKIERTKSNRIIEGMTKITAGTDRTSGPDVSDKERAEGEKEIEAGLALLNRAAPGLDEAFTNRNMGEAKVALLNARINRGDELQTPKQRANEQKRAPRRFSDSSRTALDENMEDYPAEFALEAAMGSLYEEPTVKVVGRVGAADETGKGYAPGKKGYTSHEKANAALQREQQLGTRDPSDSRREVARIEAERKERERTSAFGPSARLTARKYVGDDPDNPQPPIKIIGPAKGEAKPKLDRKANPAVEDPGAIHRTGYGKEEDELKAARRDIATADARRIQLANTLARARDIEPDRGKPAPVSFAKLAEEKAAREAAEKAEQRAAGAAKRELTGGGRKRNRSPLQYLDDVEAKYIDRPYHERPRETGHLGGKEVPLGGSLVDLWRRRTGRAMGGLAARLLPGKIQAAYDAGDIEEGQRLQKELEKMRGGWDEPKPQVEVPGMSPFMRKVLEGSLDPKDMSGRAVGGFLARLMKGQQDDIPELPKYDKPGPKMAYRGSQALLHSKGKMSPWAKDAVFGNLDPKDMTGRALGGYKEGDWWYRGGSSKQDLWNPGTVAGRESNEQYSTMGRGLYLTDKPSAEKYAQVRISDPMDDGTGTSIGGDPVVGKRRVAIDPAKIKDFSGGRFDDPELLDEWERHLRGYVNDNIDAGWLQTAGPSNTLEDIAAWRRAQKPEADRTEVTSLGQRLVRQDSLHPDKGKSIRLRQAIGSNYGVNQQIFSDFMQSKGYEGLLTQEGGEGPGGFEHPSLVVFDPKNKDLRTRFMGGFAKMAMGGGRPSSLSDLPGVLANAESVTEVGEQGREAIVGMKGGGSFVVPNHQLNSFKKMAGMATGGTWDETFGGRTGGIDIGAHLPNPGVPYEPGQGPSPLEMQPFGRVRGPEFGPPRPSIQQMATVQHEAIGKGWSSPNIGGLPDPILIDDMMSDKATRPSGLYKRRREHGRYARGYESTVDPLQMLDTETVHPRGVGQKGLRIEGGEGRAFETRRGTAGLEAENAGLAASFGDKGTMSNDVQRVYVVNMPGGGGGFGEGGAGEEATTKPKRRIAVRGAPARTAGVAEGPGRVVAEAVEALAEDEGKGTKTKSEGKGPQTKSEGKFDSITDVKRRSAAGSRARFEGEARVSDLRSQLDQVGINISEALQKSPVRALSVAMGQIAQTVVGGRAGILERSARARALGRRAESAYGELSSAETTVAGLETRFEGRFETSNAAEIRKKLSAMPEGGEREQLEQDVSTLEEARRRATEVKPVAEKRAAEAVRASETILTPGQQFRSQAVGLGGIVGGTVLFTAAMGAAQKGLELIGNIASDAHNSLSDFAFTARDTAKTLGDAVRSASGDIEGAFAGYAASTGLAAGIDISAAQEQAGIRGGAAALQQQRDLLRTQDFYANNAGPTPGLGIGFGDGLLGTWIGQQQGIAQLTASRLSSVEAPVSSFRESKFYNEEIDSQRTAGDFAGGMEEYARAERERYLTRPAGVGGNMAPDSVFAFDPAESWDEFLNSAGAGLLRNGIEPTEAGVRGMDDAALREAILSSSVTSGMPGNLPPDIDLQQRLFKLESPVAGGGGGAVQAAPRTAYAEYLADENQKDKDLNSLLGELNSSLDKVGSGFEFVIDPNRAEDFRKIMNSDAVGAGSHSGAFAERNFVAVNRNTGEMADALGTNRVLKDLSEAALFPTFEGLLTQMERGQTAAIDAQKRQFALQERLIPSNFAASYISRPMTQRDTAGIVGTTGLDPMAAAAGKEYGASIKEARLELEALAKEGRQDLRELGVPRSVIKSVSDLGKEIAKLQAGASELQLDLEQAQYNEQIRIGTRGLGDLLALNNKQSMSVGDQVVAATKLGELQRAQINDQRELARIQLARNQRQLNMQIALSRLRSPGETPEERAVRRREAEMLAKEQQQELNISKRTTERGYTIQDIQFGRQLTDAVEQLKLLQQGRDVTINVRGIQKIIEAKQQLLQVKQQYLEVPREAGIAMRRTTIGIVATMEQRLGKITEAQVKALKDFVEGVNEAYEDFDPWSDAPTKKRDRKPRGTAGDDASTKFGSRPTAAGYFGAVSGPTGFVAGEAGTEHVVVLRNPKSGMLAFNGNSGGGRNPGGSGGGMTLNMTINAQVSNEADEDRLVRKVARSLHDEYATLAGG